MAGVQGVEDGVDEGEVTGNHGVGLYLVETLVSEYGGTMEIDDHVPRGAEVTLTFRAAERPIR